MTRLVPTHSSTKAVAPFATLALVGAVIATGAGCKLSTPNAFGAFCVADAECASEDFACDLAKNACVPIGPPVAPPHAFGLACDDPLELTPVDDGTDLRRWRRVASLDGAADVTTTSACALEEASASLVLSLTTDVAMVARIRVDAAVPASIALLDAGCAAEADYGCASSLEGHHEIVVPRLEGEVRLLVRAVSQIPVDVTVTVEQVRCPVGALPEGDDCIGFVPIEGPAPRVRHQATLVDGVVFVTGGEDAAGPVFQVGLYDPLHRSWVTRSLVSRRIDHGAAVNDGVLYLVGGSDAEPYEYYSAEEENFLPGGSSITTGDMPFVHGGTLTSLTVDVPFLFVGGFIPFIATLQTAGGGCSIDSQCGSGMVCLAREDPILGFNDGICVCVESSCGVAAGDPLWAREPAPPLLRQRLNHVACNVSPREGAPEIVVIGGTNEEGLAMPALYIVASRLWGSLGFGASAPMLRDAPTGVCDRGAVIVIGGTSGADGTGDVLDVVEVFHPLVDSLASTSHMRHPRKDAAAIVFGEDVIVIGGDDGTGALATTERVARSTGTVRNGPLLPFPLRRARALTLDDGTALVVGGETADGLATQSLILLRYPARLDLPVLDGTSAPTRPGDRCASAFVLDNEQPEFLGTTFGMRNDFDIFEVDATCIDYPSAGADAFHVLTIPPEKTAVVVARSETVDVSIFAFPACEPSGDCLAGADDGVIGVGESMSVANVSSDPLQVIIVVDAYQSLDPFDYRLAWSFE